VWSRVRLKGGERPNRTLSGRFGRAGVLLLLFASAFVEGHAETSSDPAITQEFANEAINEAVNTNTLFASQDFISTGRFLQRRRGQPDSLFETFRLPAEVYFGEKGDVVRPFVLGNFALLKVTGGEAPADGQGEDDFTVSRLFAITAGSGVSVRLFEGFSIAPAFSLAFSHLRNSYDFNNSFSQTALQPQSDEFYNWGLDLFTYTPSIRWVFEREIGDGTFFHKLGYMYLLNDSLSSSSDKINIDSSSGLLTNRFEYLEPLGITIAANEVSVRPFFQWSNVSGKAAAGLRFVNMFEVGADLISQLKERFLFFSDWYVGASYVSADNFEGYHLGFGGHF